MRVLVAEDSARIRESVAFGLRKAGYCVDVSADGEEAQWRAENCGYDVIVLDLMLPKKDGLTVLRALRKSANPAHVLVLTVKDTVEDRVEGLRAGADDYLPKPFAFDELLARVEALVRRKYANKRDTLKFGEVEIDCAARRVCRAGAEIGLTPREYRLIEFLARRAGELVTRPEIEEHIYSDEKELFSNAVESAVSTLRKKIDVPGDESIIITRRGMGYMLRPER